MEMDDQFKLIWNDFSTNVVRSFSSLRNTTDFSDVTLVSSDQEKIPAHKVILSTCSEYFNNILKDKEYSSSKLLLCLENIKSSELSDILDYIYNGEVKILEKNIERFLEIAKRFQLDGLISNESDKETVAVNDVRRDDEPRYIKAETNDQLEYFTTTSVDVENKIAITTSRQTYNRMSNKIIVGTLNSVAELDEKIREYFGKTAGT